MKRLKQVQAKLRGGDPLDLAEIVRDGARRERTLTANGTKSKLSLSEKGHCVKARQRLSGKIGLARGLGREERFLAQRLALPDKGATRLRQAPDLQRILSRTWSMRAALVAICACLTVASPGCLHEGGVGDESKVAAKRERLDADRLRELALTCDVPAQVHRACETARRLATVRVLCPRLVPDVRLSDIAGLKGGPIIPLEERRFYMLDFNNAGGFADRPVRGVVHWLVGSGETRVVRRWVLTDVANEVKGKPELVRQVTAGGRRVAVYRFPFYPAGGVNGSHWAAVVRVRNELVFASLHGQRYAEAAVAMAVDLAAQATLTAAAVGFPIVVHDLTITYCGVLSVRLNGVRWRAVSTVEPAGPYRWRETEIGTFSILSPSRARFRTRSGAVTDFVRAEPRVPDLSRRCG